MVRYPSVFGILSVILGAAYAQPKELVPEKPNILLILADDLGYSDIGCFGSEIRTPNIDRIAREGMVFTQFYNNAKCTTSRASILSGMYPRGSGSSIPLSIPTVGELLKQAGYFTAMSGKWHLGDKAPQRPYDRGFDEYYGLMDGAANFFNPSQPDPAFKGGKTRSFGHNEKLITKFPPGFYTTDAFADHAIKTIRQAVNGKRPFFLHLAFNAPHYPLHAFPEDIAKYRGKYRMGWDELRRQRYARQIEMGLLKPEWALSTTDSEAYAWAEANHDWEDHRMATYAAMIDRMDRKIGEVLTTLDELGISQNTIVIFLSDNGGCTEEPGGRDDSQTPGVASTYTTVGPAWGWAQNTPFRRYKSWANEGGISTPFVVRWPAKIKAGTRSGEMGHVIDLVPTFLEVGGANKSSVADKNTMGSFEGRSLLALWEGKTRAEPSSLFWEWGGNCAVRTGRWKLVWDTLRQPAKWELYDMDVDRTETKDVAELYPEQVKDMSSRYESWAKATNRALPGSKKAKAKQSK